MQNRLGIDAWCASVRPTDQPSEPRGRVTGRRNWSPTQQSLQPVAAIISIRVMRVFEGTGAYAARKHAQAYPVLCELRPSAAVVWVGSSIRLAHALLSVALAFARGFHRHSPLRPQRKDDINEASFMSAQQNWKPKSKSEPDAQLPPTNVAANLATRSTIITLRRTTNAMIGRCYAQQQCEQCGIL